MLVLGIRIVIEDILLGCCNSKRNGVLSRSGDGTVSFVRPPGNVNAITLKVFDIFLNTSKNLYEIELETTCSVFCILYIFRKYLR